MVRNGINQCKVTAPALGLFKMNSIAQLSRRQCHADILLEAAERPLVWGEQRPWQGRQRRLKNAVHFVII